jgi:hypothetical protein
MYVRLSNRWKGWFTESDRSSLAPCTRPPDSVSRRTTVLGRPGSSGPNDLRETITRHFAPMARFGADAVVLVMSCVPLTLRAAHAARFNARGELRAKEIEVPFSLSRHDLSRRLTDDGAIEAEPDALDEIRDFGLGKRIVGARRARLNTLDARLDALDHHCLVGLLDLLPDVEVQHPTNQLLCALRCCHGRHSRMKVFDEINPRPRQQ